MPPWRPGTAASSRTRSAALARARASAAGPVDADPLDHRQAARPRAASAGSPSPCTCRWVSPATRRAASAISAGEAPTKTPDARHPGRHRGQHRRPPAPTSTRRGLPGGEDHADAPDAQRGAGARPPPAPSGRTPSPARRPPSGAHRRPPRGRPLQRGSNDPDVAPAPGLAGHVEGAAEDLGPVAHAVQAEARSGTPGRRRCTASGSKPAPSSVHLQRRAAPRPPCRRTCIRAAWPWRWALREGLLEDSVERDPLGDRDAVDRELALELRRAPRQSAARREGHRSRPPGCRSGVRSSNWAGRRWPISSRISCSAPPTVS